VHHRLRYRRRIQPPRFSRWRSDPRVLVEESDGATRESFLRVLEQAGFEAVGCGGPDENSGSRCALSGPAGCAAAADADVVFFSLRHSDPVNQEVLRALKRRYPHTPIVVEIPKPKELAHHDLLIGTHPVYSPITRRTLARSVREAWASSVRAAD